MAVYLGGPCPSGEPTKAALPELSMMPAAGAMCAFSAAGLVGLFSVDNKNSASVRSDAESVFSLEEQLRRGNGSLFQTGTEKFAAGRQYRMQSIGVHKNSPLSVVLCAQQTQQFPGRISVEHTAGKDMQIVIAVPERDVEIRAHAVSFWDCRAGINNRRGKVCNDLPYMKIVVNYC